MATSTVYSQVDNHIIINDTVATAVNNKNTTMLVMAEDANAGYSSVIIIILCMVATTLIVIIILVQKRMRMGRNKDSLKNNKKRRTFKVCGILIQIEFYFMVYYLHAYIVYNLSLLPFDVREWLAYSCCNIANTIRQISLSLSPIEGVKDVTGNAIPYRRYVTSPEHELQSVDRCSTTYMRYRRNKIFLLFHFMRNHGTWLLKNLVESSKHT